MEGVLKLASIVDANPDLGKIVLVAKAITSKSLNFKLIQTVLMGPWKFRDRISFKSLATNVFL